MRLCKVGCVAQRPKELCKAHRGMIGATGELNYFSAYISLKEPDKSEDKVEGGTSVETLILYFHRGKALVAKGAEEVENTRKLQVPRQGRRAEIKELYKTGVNRLLIKIVENEGLRVDVGMLDQGTK
ncbi:hypothetical protein B296_00029941 [Ensete ventricosum]|uniref:Uncharacterized protein n=1 Tax=Ensete ventricosum TaxID=4639 RepID=A0A426ZC76_ENSVE|nr:hypothetical protein B296_00029941 [Ensete ventricosum]